MQLTQNVVNVVNKVVFFGRISRAAALSGALLGAIGAAKAEAGDNGKQVLTVPDIAVELPNAPEQFEQEAAQLDRYVEQFASHAHVIEAYLNGDESVSQIRQWMPISLV